MYSERKLIMNFYFFLLYNNLPSNDSIRQTIFSSNYIFIL